MKVKSIIIIIVWTTIQQSSFGQFEKYSSFNQLDSLWVGYMLNNQLDSATLVFEYAQRAYPERDKDITYTLGFLYALAKRDSLAIAMWSYGQPKGYYFAIERYHTNEQFKTNEKFIALAGRDKQIGDSLNNLSHVEYEVRLPENYSSDSIYPLLFVFHGGGASNEIAKINWTSKLMNKNFITVFIQSYVIGFRYAFDWILNDEKTNKEFREIYMRIIDDYPVSKDKVYFLGFSAGGKIAIDYAFNDFVPVSGLILNCPGMPDLSDDSIIEFVKKGRKIVIITGEKDWALNNQQRLISRVTKADGIGRIIIKKGIGHQYSIDFSDLLEEYLKWIIE